jgi:S1-C subfamily serine protease
VTWVDAAVVVWVVLAAFVGYQRGLTAQLLSLAGLAVGGLVGSRVGPFFLRGGDSSPWVALASLIGALGGALVFQTAAGVIGARLRRRVAARKPLELADGAGGIVVGAALGLMIAWLGAVAALQLDRPGLRAAVRDSAILSGLVDAVPPRSVLQTLAKLDPLPLIATPPDLRLAAPDPSVLASPVATRAGASVVKVEGVACGVGVQGSGWVVRRGLVATNVHVVAGTEALVVYAPDGQALAATPVYLDVGDDLALLRVRGLRARPLPRAGELPSDDRVILLGYPEDGPLTAAAGRAGQPVKVFAADAYERRTKLRSVVPLRGRIRRGDSGGPVVNTDGEVVATMFAASRQGGGGFGVPVSEVEIALEAKLRPVSPGPCTG